MYYQTYEPSIALADFVKCFWVLESPASTGDQKQRIVPDGCMEMIFHYGDLYRQYITGTDSIIQPRSFVFGQITTPLEIEPTGECGIFAVRFLPDGFMPFATMPLQEMADKAVPLQELFGEEGVQLADSVLHATDHTARIGIIEAFLTNRLSMPGVIDRVVNISVAAIVDLDGQLSVSGLAEQVNVNRRQLERKFAQAIGLSPKQLSKIIRLQATIKRMQSQAFGSLTEIAYDGEYYDQAHLIRDFKEFTGVTPKQFYANNLKMSALFAGTE